MHPDIQAFLKDWKQIRGKTLDFLQTMPQEKMTWRPHELLGTFGMQIRHIGKSQESYINGIKSGKIDFSDKKFDPEIEKNKEKALLHLKKLDEELVKTISDADPGKEIIFIDGVLGELRIPLRTVLSYLVDHEYYHQGIFTCYGRLAGLGKFLFM